jgi:hypothetical protein
LTTRPARARRLVLLALLLAFAVVAVVVVPRLWDRYGDRLFSSDRCTVTVDGVSRELTAEQTENAAIIVAIGQSRGLPPRATVIALATSLQESDLRNLAFGDRDSIGLFQQRPSQGWGTPEEIADRHYAAGAFYDALLAVDGWETLPLTEAAQAVQRSAFPEAYAQHEDEAIAWNAGLRGEAGPTAVTCRLGGNDGADGAVEAFLDRLADDYGTSVFASSGAAGEATVDVVVRSRSNVPVDALAAWSVASAKSLRVDSVAVCGWTWTRGAGEWASTEKSDCDADAVVVTLRLG